MRTLLLATLAAVSLAAQPKPAEDRGGIAFRQVTGGTFSGFNEDERAEKAWDASARRSTPVDGGRWEMEQLQFRSFRDARPAVSFVSPSGTLDPGDRSAVGPGALEASSSAFTLAGKGWKWRSTPKGDVFSIFSEVRAQLDIDRPPARRWTVSAKGMEAVPAPGGTSLTFDDGVTMTREGERIECRRVVCLLEDDPKGGARCRFIDAVGEVRRTVGAQTFRGELARFDVLQDVLEMSGGVRFEDEGVAGSAATLRHEAGPGRTSLVRGESVPVLLHLVRKGEDPAELSGDAVTFTRRPGQTLALLDVRGRASYLTPTAGLRADAISASDTADGSGLLTASGSVSGEVEGRAIQGGRAVWNRAMRRLDLSGPPCRISDPRGFVATGDAIRADLVRSRFEVRGVPAARATVTVPSAQKEGTPGRAEADQVVVLDEEGALQMEMLGSVRYAGDGVTIESDQFVAFALPVAGDGKPRPKGSERGHELSKAIAVGNVRYAQAGLKAMAERVDLVPAVQVEEVVKADAIRGRPRLLTLSGGAGETRPRLHLSLSDGQASVFTADSHEVLHSPQLTKFFLRGSVTMDSGDTKAKCDLLEGLAAPGKEGRLEARQVVGRGAVIVEGAGTRAQGRTLEISPSVGEARLSGDASILAKDGTLGLPARELVYDMRRRAWRMPSSQDERVPGQVVRPRIYLGRDFTLPEVKSLDNSR
ncbi:MAG: hypothetical protein ACKO4N_02960 [Verrucomicrobiota bacterium]